MAMFQRSVQACVSLLILLECSHALGASDVCTHFQKEVVQIDATRGPYSKRAVGGASLCFPDSGPCSGGSTPANQFWAHNPSPGEAAALKAELETYADVSGNVSRLAVAGRPSPITRIARYVGTAHCIRDTYMGHTNHGYRRISSPALEKLSAEAGYCRGSYVFYRNWHGQTYAILAEKADNWQRITVSQVDHDMQFKTVCSMRYPRTEQSGS